MWQQHPRNLLLRTGQATEQASGDDGTYQAGWPGTTRMVDLGNGTVYDRATGLTWVKDHTALDAPLNGEDTWATQLAACNALSYAGHEDWRMPNLMELLSVSDAGSTFSPCCRSPLVMVESQYYWTSTTRAKYPATNRYTIWFADCCEVSMTTSGTSKYCIPVRGGRING